MSAKYLLLAAFLVVILFGGRQTVSALQTAHRTGVLAITTTESGATLSISQEKHQAAGIGKGNTKVRLAPGTYLVLASNNGSHASAVAVVHQGQTTKTSLKFGGSGGGSSTSSGSSNRLRSTEDVDYEGEGALLNEGVSSAQVEEMEQYFFQFKPSVSNVSINPNSLERGAHNPNIINPFSINFQVSVDQTVYAATISYYDTNNITLTLYNLQTNAQVFTAGSISPPSP